MEMNTNLENLIDVLRTHRRDLTLPEDIYNAMAKYFSEEKEETEYRMNIRLIPKSTSPYNLAFEKHYKILASNEVELAKGIFSHIRPLLINSELKIGAIVWRWTIVHSLFATKIVLIPYMHSILNIHGNTMSDFDLVSQLLNLVKQ